MLESRENWQNEEHECTHCGWRGCGTALVQHSITSDFVEMRCPGCDQPIALALAPEALDAVRIRERVRAHG